MAHDYGLVEFDILCLSCSYSCINGVVMIPTNPASKDMVRVIFNYIDDMPRNIHNSYRFAVSGHIISIRPIEKFTDSRLRFLGSPTIHICADRVYLSNGINNNRTQSIEYSDPQMLDKLEIFIRTLQ